MNSFVLESIANVSQLVADDTLLTVAVKKGKESQRTKSTNSWSKPKANWEGMAQ